MVKFHNDIMQGMISKRFWHFTVAFENCCRPEKCSLFPCIINSYWPDMASSQGSSSMKLNAKYYYGLRASYTFQVNNLGFFLYLCILFCNWHYSCSYLTNNISKLIARVWESHWCRLYVSMFKSGGIGDIYSVLMSNLANTTSCHQLYVQKKGGQIL